MSVVNTITLLINGLTLALSLGFLLIVLWQDARKELNQTFGVFLFLVTLWNLGSLITLAVSIVDSRSPFIGLAISVMELGFTGSSIAVYALIAVLIGMHTRRFRVLVFISLIIVLGYQIFLIVNRASIPFETLEDGFFKYRFQSVAALFYILFDGTGLILLWRYRRKIQSVGLFAGLNIFVVGQSLGFLNPELQVISLSINLCSIATLIISFAILRQEIITPLAERITQVAAVHRVSLAITSQIAINTVLNEITTQAAGWLNADGAGIFLNKGQYLELATVHNLPNTYLHAHIPIGEGATGTVAKTQKSIYLENYDRDWKSKQDLPLARETFGSVICVPLVYGGETIGVLMVIAGKHGRLFQKEDVDLLELLAAQAAVAIAHSHSFAEQQELAQQVEAARSQLETVLTSTENPVIAVDRGLKVIFANPAAQSIFQEQKTQQLSIRDTIPTTFLPANTSIALRQLYRNNNYTYEIKLGTKTYLCHLGQLGRPRPSGWVGVLNDITQLKELDRIKSEMVRMTSHDLKNPLQAAIANLDLLAEDVENNNQGEMKKSIEIIEKQLLRMNRIISGILDMERIKTGSINLQLCDPATIIKETIDDLQYLAKDNQIKLTSDIPTNLPNFAAEPTQIKQALINLTENAIKFTNSGGNVIIKVRQTDDTITFEITDNGIGIPESLQGQIFERFLRGGKHGQLGAEHITGSGLGLSLVKTIVENHGGKIWVTSEVGNGSTFYIRFPTMLERLSITR